MTEQPDQTFRWHDPATVPIRMEEAMKPESAFTFTAPAGARISPIRYATFQEITAEVRPATRYERAVLWLRRVGGCIRTRR